MENYRKRLVAAALALTLIGNGAGVLTGCSNKNETKSVINTTMSTSDNSKKSKIREYYGDKSFESDVIAYLELAQKLEKYDFKSIPDYNGEIISNVWGTADLLSPIEISDLMRVYEESFSDKYSDSDRLDVAMALKHQKQLLHNYLLKEGYLIVYGDYNVALKDYVAKEYNIPKYTNLKLYRNENSSEGTFSYIGVYQITGSSEEHIFYIAKSDINSINGIEFMINLQNVIKLSNNELEELYVNALAAAIEYNNKTNIKNNNYTKQG